MEKTLNVTLAIKVDTDLEKVGDIVDSLSFEVTPNDEMVEVKGNEVVEFFEVY
jgi:hypothetical protein